MKRLLLIFGVIAFTGLVSACDSTSSVATVTARAQGTNTINITLTAVFGPPIVPTAPPPVAGEAQPTPAPAVSTQPATQAATSAATSAATQPASAATQAATQPATQPATQAATAAPTKVALEPMGG